MHPMLNISDWILVVCYFSKVSSGAENIKSGTSATSLTLSSKERFKGMVSEFENY